MGARFGDGLDDVGRASLFSCFNSCRSRSAPRSVMGVRLIKTAAFFAVS
jgi:hypothetical protein